MKILSSILSLLGICAVALFDEHAGFVPVLLSAAVCMLSSMNGMTAPSVSLEGKSLWIVQSLPLSPWQILRAKLRMQLLLTVIPVLFCVVCIAFVYSYSIIELIFALLVPITFVLLYAQFGLSLGLKMPNLNHTSEITPIKQSAGVAFTSLGGFGYAVLMFVGFLLTGGQRTDFVIYMSVFIMINIALCVLLHLWLRGKGCRRFISL